MMEMLPEHHAQWETELRHILERMAAKGEQMAAQCIERTEGSTAGPRPNMYMIVNPVQYSGGAKELD